MVELRTHEVLLAVVARLEVLEWWRSTVSFSWTVTTTEEVVLVSVVVVDLSSKVLLHLHQKTEVWSIDSDGDGGGWWWPATASRGRRQWRAEQSRACVRRKGNGIGSPLATSMHGDKVSTHMGRWRQPAVAGVAALTWRWHGDQAVAHAHGYG
jgi:hypothetical protein